MLSKSSTSSSRSFWLKIINGFASAAVLMLGNAAFFWLGLFGDAHTHVAPYVVLVAVVMALPWLVIKLAKK